MSNETRELLERAVRILQGHGAWTTADELRALLAKPESASGKLPPIGRQSIWQAIDEALTGTVEPMLRGDICNILAALLVPAAQNQGEPVCRGCGDSGVIDDKDKDELPSGHYVEKGLVSCPACEDSGVPVHRPHALASSLREAMENASARGNPCQLIVGATHVSVTYRGIKWVHTQISAGNQQHALAIEEFDETVTSALGGRP